METTDAKSPPPSVDVRDEMFQAEVNSTFEPWLIATIFEPMLARLPRALAPNTISLIGHVICWSAAGLAWASTFLSPLMKALALVGTGVLTFFATAADSLDGMQARRTGRTSKLGELLDHWLDSIHVPLVTTSLTLALGLDPLWVVLVHITNTGIYHGQLVIYHHTGRFVHPPTSGVDAQFGTAVGFLIIAVYLGVWGRITWLNTAASLIAVIIQLKQNLFYWRRMSARQAFSHLLFYLLASGFAALYLLGAMSTVAFVLLIVFVSFRLTGTFVLRTIVGQPFSGWDTTLLVWIVVIAGVHFLFPTMRVLGLLVSSMLPYLAMATMAGRNLIDLGANMRKLRPSKEHAAS